MMLQMLGVFAEFEHATIVDRITAGIERRAKEGRWYSGRPPFGYTLHDGQLVPDPITAPIVRRIFALYTHDRLGTIAIAHQLRAEHAPAPTAGWGHPAVHRVLTNPTYLGRIRWRNQDFASEHEPLVDPDTFQQAQAILAERGTDASRRRGNRSDSYSPASFAADTADAPTSACPHAAKAAPTTTTPAPPAKSTAPKPAKVSASHARSSRPPSCVNSPTSTATAGSSTTPSPPSTRRRRKSDPCSMNAAARSTPRSQASNARPSATSRPSSKAGSPLSAASSA